MPKVNIKNITRICSVLNEIEKEKKRCYYYLISPFDFVYRILYTALLYVSINKLLNKICTLDNFLNYIYYCIEPIHANNILAYSASKLNYLFYPFESE